MAKEKSPCNSDVVPDSVIVEQVEKLKTMVDACAYHGGSLEIRMLYGCGNPDKKLGDSNRIKWPPEGYRDRELTEAEKIYLADILRQLMEAAELEATKNCPKGSESAFVVQGFCKAPDGTVIKRPGHPGEVLPPFVVSKKKK